jgi:hypothetical protein
MRINRKRAPDGTVGFYGGRTQFGGAKACRVWKLAGEWSQLGPNGVYEVRVLPGVVIYETEAEAIRYAERKWGIR